MVEVAIILCDESSNALARQVNAFRSRYLMNRVCISRQALVGRRWVEVLLGNGNRHSEENQMMSGEFIKTKTVFFPKAMCNSEIACDSLFRISIPWQESNASLFTPVGSR
ncbi:hypothetical protein NPIL_268651 [Nephila pilipes]|uniref:Uncharacterized protein n=1 Tax=Nephila pilipes TaxID=299642 RepID=A0A8X6TI76_NEPPI|nr:hypothetical protein NPIL_268651 [Nephila pilipes]